MGVSGPLMDDSRGGEMSIMKHKQGKETQHCEATGLTSNLGLNEQLLNGLAFHAQASCKHLHRSIP